MGGKKRNKAIVYCSGPLFSREEVKTMAEIARVLENAGYATFLPHRDGVEAYVMNHVNSPLANAYIFSPVKKLINKAVFALDIYQITECCDFFVFNMNGRVPDEGGVVEAAVALASGKPVLLYKNDSRSLAYGMDSAMLTGVAGPAGIIKDISKIPPELKRIAENHDTWLQKAKEWSSPYPLNVKRVNKFGKRVWRLLGLIKILKPQNSLLS